MKRKLLLFALAVLVIGALAACATGGGYYGGSYYMVRTPPPPPPVGYGIVGVAPGPGFVWVNGFWDWRGARWHWVPGAWMRPPRRGAVWIAPSWRPYRGGYRFYAGRWR